LLVVSKSCFWERNKFCWTFHPSFRWANRIILLRTIINAKRNLIP